MLLPILALLAGCPHVDTHTGPPRTSTADYGVAVAVASGARVVTSLYELQIRHDRADIWTFVTTHSEGSWEENGEAILYNSDTRRDTDPWPVIYQHAISGVPTALLMVDGSPSGLWDAEQWKVESMKAIASVDLPVASLETGAALIDADGVVRDMKRNFPGTPTTGLWTRDVSIAAIPAQMLETCSVEDAGKTRIYTCKGTAEGPTQGSARLHDVTTESRMVTDANGLVEFDTQWAGTLVMLAPDQKGVIDRPIAGHRVVRRKNPVPAGG